MSCCEDRENLEEVSRETVPQAVHALAPDLEGYAHANGQAVKYQCKVCGRKHYVLEVEPLDLKFEGSAL